MTDSTVGTVTLRHPSGTPFYLHFAILIDARAGTFSVTYCDLEHDEPMDWTDCPIASRWTLVHTSS